MNTISVEAKVGLASLVLFSGLAVAQAESTWEHPFTGHGPLLKVSAVYHPEHAATEMSSGDITFTAPKPPVASLTPAEIYMVAGSKGSNLPGGEDLDPWVGQTIRMIMNLERVNGSLPNVLDDSAIRSIPYYKDWPSAELDVYRNPLTGAWPRLDAIQPSPGDMYVRKLTESEKQTFARKLNQEDVWMKTSGPGKHLCSPVYYHRVYGWNGPLYESLPFITCND
jgi:hypothetical protein